MAILSVPGTLKEVGPRIVRLTLQIGSATYAVEVIEHGPLARHVFRLTRENGPTAGEQYDVALLADGSLSCDCADWTFKQSKVGGNCKHLAALAPFLVPPRRPAA